MWFVIYEIATGKLVSSGTVTSTDAELLRKGLAKIELQEKPSDQLVWDESSKTFIVREVIKGSTELERDRLLAIKDWSSTEVGEAVRLLINIKA